MNLRKLLIFHAIITLAAAVVLVAAPALIPGTVSIHFAREQYLLSYFLGAAELSIAVLSLAAVRLHDRQALQAIVYSLMIFHGTTGVLEIVVLVQGGSINLVGNLLLRSIIVILFYYFGPRKNYGLSTTQAA